MNMFGNFNTQFMASFVGHLKSSTLVEGQISYTIYDDYKSQITYKWHRCLSKSFYRWLMVFCGRRSQSISWVSMRYF